MLDLAIDAERNAAYIMEQGEDGRDLVYRMALDGSGRRDLTAAHPGVDIDNVVRLGRRGRVIGVTYATERRRVTGTTGAQGLPGIVMPHGGPGARDEWGFDWLAQFFANRGFAVLQPNFRGSAGYGDEWFRINGFQSWRTAIGDVNDAGRWLVGQGADPAKLAIVGWSYGGYAALQSGVVDPALFRAVVAIAPVTDLQDARDEWLGWSNSANLRDYFGMGLHIAEGSPARHAAQLRAPVLMFHGEMDRNVRVHQSRLMRDRLRDAGRSVELVEFPELDHQLQDSAARARMLSRSDQFLRETLGIQ